jgi:hypothetical protein
VVTGLGRCVRQFGGYGMYAVVGVEVSPHDAGLTMTFADAVSDDPAAAEFRPAVEVGVRYAWEKLSRDARPPGVAVRVTEVRVMAADTTEIAVVYAAALALWDGLKMDPERPIKLVPEARSLQFPV